MINRYIHIFIILIAIQGTGLAQINLVPNPGFEEYNNCPVKAFNLHEAIPWFDPAASYGWSTTEFYHLCSSDSLFLQVMAEQDPRTDSGMAGATFFAFNYREYLEVELIDSLIEGTVYCLDFWVSFSGKSMACDHIGAHLSDTPIFYTSSPPVLLKPAQVYQSDSIITDSENWTKIHGSFTATGVEKFLVIGVLFPTPDVNYTTFPGVWPYYFVDDIAVYRCDAPRDSARAGPDIQICLGDSVMPGSHALPEYRYYWYKDSVLVSRDPNPVFHPWENTSYHLLVKDFAFHETHDTIYVKVADCNAMPAADAGNDTIICLGDQLTLGNMVFTDYQYKWFILGDTIPISTVNTLTIYPISNNNYVLQTIDYMGQVSADTVFVEVIDCNTPLANAGNDTMICLGDSALIGTAVYNGLDHLWFNGSTIVGNEPRIWVNPEISTSYMLAVQDPHKNIHNDYVEVIVEPCDIPLEIPNVITPNTDGYNDEFIIINPMQAELDVKIFNRWGKLVFHGDEYTPWDAKSDERSNPSGVYYYVVTATKHMRRNTVYNGVVHVVR